MKFVKYLNQLGFAGVRQKPLHRLTQRQAKAAYFESVDPTSIRKQLGKAVIHNAKSGRFLFRMSPSRAVRIDTVNKIVVLANGQDVVRQLSLSMEK
jgi:hypothetical protein